MAKKETLLRCKPVYTTVDRIVSMCWGAVGGTATAAFVGWLTGAPWLVERLSQMIELVVALFP